MIYGKYDFLNVQSIICLVNSAYMPVLAVSYELFRQDIHQIDTRFIIRQRSPGHSVVDHVLQSQVESSCGRK